MIKKENGITLLILSVTVVVLLILATVTVNTGYNVLIDVRAGRVISNLDLIKTKAEALYDNYEFSADKDLLVGAGGLAYSLRDITNDYEMVGIIDEISNYDEIVDKEVWYKWDLNTMKSQGLDTELLKNGDIFVNYEDGEIIYTAGATVDNKNYMYTLTAIKKAFEEI